MSLIRRIWLLVAALTAVVCMAQNTESDNNSVLPYHPRTLSAYSSPLRLQKTHIHTDAADYRAGSRIWLRVYLLDARTLTEWQTEEFVLVDLLSPEGKLIHRVKLTLQEGVFGGYIDLPTTLSAGQYMLRTYPSNTSDNDMQYAGKQIVYIHANQEQTKTDSTDFRIRLFPEGGWLVDAKKVRVLVEVATIHGRRPDQCKVEISEESTGQPVASVMVEKGIGLLEIEGKAGERYVAHATVDGRTFVSEACRCPERSIALRAESTDSTVLVCALGNISIDRMMIVAQMHDSLLFTLPIEMNTPLLIDTDQWPQGVACLMLTDSKQHVMSERLVYHHKTDTTHYIVWDNPTTDRIQLHFDTALLLPGEKASLSVSVTDRYAISRHRQYDIFRSILLQGDLPELLQADIPDDLQLMMYGWTRYNQPAMPIGTLPFTHDIANGNIITGIVTTVYKEKPLPGTVVNIIIPETYAVATDTTDSLGRFVFDISEMPEATSAMLFAMRSSGNENVRLTIDSDTVPSSCIMPQYVTAEYKPILSIELNDITESIILDEIQVTAKRSQESKKELFRKEFADASFDMSKIEEYDAANLYDLLRYVSGVTIENDKCFIRGSHSIYARNPAAIAVNGIIQDDFYDLSLIPIQDVARLDVFKSGKMVIWGAKGGAGVISIILKDGSELPETREICNIKRVHPLGWQQPEEFYLPLAEQNIGRYTTLMWSASWKGDTISIQRPAIPTVLDVVVEGVTDKGRLIHCTSSAESE